MQRRPKVRPVEDINEIFSLLDATNDEGKRYVRCGRASGGLQQAHGTRCHAVKFGVFRNGTLPIRKSIREYALC